MVLSSTVEYSLGHMARRSGKNNKHSSVSMLGMAVLDLAPAELQKSVSTVKMKDAEERKAEHEKSTVKRTASTDSSWKFGLFGSKSSCTDKKVTSGSSGSLRGKSSSKTKDKSLQGGIMKIAQQSMQLAGPVAPAPAPVMPEIKPEKLAPKVQEAAQKSDKNETDKTSKSARKISSNSKRSVISLLCFAAMENDVKSMRNLLTNYDFTVNDLSQGSSPLHQAAAAGSRDCLVLLLEAGAEVNLKDAQNRTPLEYAVLGAQFDCAAILIERGAKTDSIKDGLK